MPDFSLTILYVDNPPSSAAFYTDLLGSEPMEISATFAMLPLKAGVMLGLWSHHTVEPKAMTGGGGTELAFVVPHVEDVDRTFNVWKAKGLRIQQEPVELDFGRTFVALDPDGHRLRILSAA